MTSGGGGLGCRGRRYSGWPRNNSWGCLQFLPKFMSKNSGDSPPLSGQISGRVHFGKVRSPWGQPGPTPHLPLRVDPLAGGGAARGGHVGDAGHAGAGAAGPRAVRVGGGGGGRRAAGGGRGGRPLARGAGVPVGGGGRGRLAADGRKERPPVPRSCVAGSEARKAGFVGIIFRANFPPKMVTVTE